MPSVLIVDDQEDVRTFCSRVLRRLGYQTASVASGREALELLDEQPFDLLITDVMMPEMTGTELLERAREQLPDLPAVVITGYADVDLATRAIRAGACDFVTKPFGIPDLKEAIEHALEQASLAEEAGRLKTLDPFLELLSGNLAGLDDQEWARRILDIVLPAAEAGCGAILLSGGQSDELRVLAATRQGGGPIPDLAPLAERLEGLHELRVVDAQELKRDLPGICLERGAVMLVPLWAEDHLLGGLVLARSDGRLSFQQGQIETVRVLAAQVAAYWENHCLVRELAEWNRDLERCVLDRTRSLREAQDKLLRSERLATVGRLGASVAHELRNPLGVINNSIYYLRTKLRDANPKITKHLDIVEREVGTANGIITDLMSFVRVPQMRLELTDANQLLAAALARVPAPANVEVIPSYTQGLPLVQADVDKMQQVFTNLLQNAVQAMPQGGVLRVGTEMSEGQVVFRFRDSGVGIAEEDMARIFEPLFTTKAKGIGLGLSIVKLLIEAQEGVVRVSSQPGQGACFTVAIPAAVSETEGVAVA